MNIKRLNLLLPLKMKKYFILILSIALISVGCKNKKQAIDQQTPNKTQSTQATTQKLESNQNEEPKEVFEPPYEKEGAQINIEKTGNMPQNDGPAHKTEEPRLLLLQKTSINNEFPNDSYIINNVSIYQNQIIVSLSYSGGCGGAEFIAIWNGMLMKSYPPKANIELRLRDNDDCEALVNEKVYIDITPLINEVGNGGVFVHLNGWDAPLDFTTKK